MGKINEGLDHGEVAAPVAVVSMNVVEPCDLQDFVLAVAKKWLNAGLGPVQACFETVEKKCLHNNKFIRDRMVACQQAQICSVQCARLTARCGTSWRFCSIA